MPLLSYCFRSAMSASSVGWRQMIDTGGAPKHRVTSLMKDFDGGRMRVHSAALSFLAAAHTAFAAAGAAGDKPTCAVSARSGTISIVSAGTGAYRLIAMRSTTRLSSATTIALIASSAALM